MWGQPQQQNEQDVWQALYQQELNEQENQRKALRKLQTQLPFNWQFEPKAPLVLSDGTLTDNYRGILLTIFNRFDSDSDGELSLHEFNQMNAFFGDPPLTQEVFEKACKLYDHACGEPPKLGGEAFLLVALDELLETTDKHLASLSKAGFEVSPDVSPTPQLKQSIKQAALARAHRAIALQSQISRTMHEMQRNIINHFPTGGPSSGSSYCYRCHRYGCSGFC